jgi:hypothetical protein
MSIGLKELENVGSHMSGIVAADFFTIIKSYLKEN